MCVSRSEEAGGCLGVLAHVCHASSREAAGDSEVALCTRHTHWTGAGASG